jgi:hypothetical protein
MMKDREQQDERHDAITLTLEPSCKDEARIGQKNGVVRQWARRGTRPRQPADQRYTSAYLFGAICPARGTGAALAMPYVDTEAMQAHIDEISRHVARGAHAVLIMDRAGWHTTARLKVPKNITPIFLPSRAPELNPVENPRVKPGGKRLAVPAQQLAVEPRLRRLRGDHRGRLRRLAQASRPATHDHVDRNAGLGACRSGNMTVGISGFLPRLGCHRD